MREKIVFVIMLCIALTYSAETSQCESDNDCGDLKICENYECVDICDYYSCGINATCEIIEKYGRVNCKCKKGYSGDPKVECFKLNEESPCDPNMCGKHSTCIEDDKQLGPHCECLSDYDGYPPNCGIKCNSKYDCADTEICEYGLCYEMCDNCGENSNCRVDKVANKFFCSCKDGYIPERGVGCRKKLRSDIEIPLDMIALKTTNICKENCGYAAYCDESGFCKCTQGYKGDPNMHCKFIESADVIDECHPNQCGSLTKCEIIQGNASCSCIDGFGHYPSCFSCSSSLHCENDKLCVSGRCIENVCANYCGFHSDCKIINGSFTCSCATEDINKPFTDCKEKYPVMPIKAAAIRVLAAG